MKIQRLLLSFVTGAEPIEVPHPLDRIRHGEIYTYPVMAHRFVEKGARLFYNTGVSIEMMGDYADVADGLLTATHVEGHTNLILLNVPGLPQSVTSKNAGIQHDLDALDSVKDGHNKALTSHRAQQDDDKWLKHLVIFPPSMNLCNKPFHSDEFKANDDMIPEFDVDYTVTHIRRKTAWKEQVPGTDGNPVERSVYTYDTWIKWCFVDLNSLDKLSNPAGKKKSTANAKIGDLTKFSSMNLDDSDSDDGE